MSDARTFLQAIMAWPGDDEPGYVNVHWKDPREPRGMPGYACRTVDQLLNKLPWMLSKKWDVYFCTSLQLDHGKPDKRGALLAARDATKSVNHKCIFLDTDIKEGKNGYATYAELIEAFEAFLKAAGLPPPCAAVHSGGGRHVYWISDRALSPTEWRAYAEGLKNLVHVHGFKCDVGIIADAARVLRIPETFNYKIEDEPRPVRLEFLNAPIDFAEKLGHIKVAVVQPPTQTSQAAASQPTDFYDEAKFPKRNVAVVESLSSGIGLSDAPINPANIFAKSGCPFFRNALETGGAECHEPEWAQHMLGATFMEGGRELAHALGRNHKDYTPASTDAKFQSKVNARKGGRVGWPSCDAIRAAGCSACGACQHYKKIKSPLNLATMTMKVHVTAAVSEIKWRGGTTKGLPKPGYTNAKQALEALGISCSYDMFREKYFVHGMPLDYCNGELSDDAVREARELIQCQYYFEPEKGHMREAFESLSKFNSYDPVLDYFKSLRWDGTPRLDRLLIDYFGADDTAFVRAATRAVVCAIVRRAKIPGSKFDHMLVLIGNQGVRKSLFCNHLAVFPDLFTDASELNGTMKEQMEACQGKQVIEFAELAGFSAASREKNKANLSRHTDRARMAYAHYAKEMPRKNIPVGTTNPTNFLSDPTGERRYWPIAVKEFDVEGFLAVKDQIYAEAVVLEPHEKLWLTSPKVIQEHLEVIDTVKEPDAFIDLCEGITGEEAVIGVEVVKGEWAMRAFIDELRAVEEISETDEGEVRRRCEGLHGVIVNREERLSTHQLYQKLNIFTADLTSMPKQTQRRISDAMVFLGWKYSTFRDEKGQVVRGWKRPMKSKFERKTDDEAQEACPGGSENPMGPDVA